jgi:glycogen debranching enzyme
MAVAATDALEATEDESQFRIEATAALREPRTRTFKHAETFGVLNQFGDMLAEPGSPDGLYHQDTRFLSQLELRLNGDRPLLLSSNPAEDGSVLPVDLANADTTAADGSELRRELIYLNRRQFIWRSAYYELLQIRNFDLRRHQVSLSVRFGADFADIFEVRGLKRRRRGKRSSERLSADAVALRYVGLDGIERVTTLQFSPAPAQLDRSNAEFVLDLGPGEGCRSRCVPDAAIAAARFGPSAAATANSETRSERSEHRAGGRPRSRVRTPSSTSWPADRLPTSIC